MDLCSTSDLSLLHHLPHSLELLIMESANVKSDGDANERGPRTEMTTSERLLAISLRNRKLSYKQIANRLGRPQSTIWHTIREHGATSGVSKPRSGRKKRLTEENIAAIREVLDHDPHPGMKYLLELTHLDKKQTSTVRRFLAEEKEREHRELQEDLQRFREERDAHAAAATRAENEDQDENETVDHALHHAAALFLIQQLQARNHSANDHHDGSDDSADEAAPSRGVTSSSHDPTSNIAQNNTQPSDTLQNQSVKQTDSQPNDTTLNQIEKQNDTLFYDDNDNQQDTDNHTDPDTQSGKGTTKSIFN